MKLEKIIKLTNNKYLNMYKMYVKNKKNNDKEYFMVSRREEDKLTCKTGNHEYCDGVMIIPITRNNELILIKQFRVPINDYIFEFPAGLIDKDESIEIAAKRELFEETGLQCIKYEYLLKPSYTSVGMTDETVAVVKMIVEGEPTNKYTEDNEEIEIIKVPMNKCKEFVSKNNVSIKTALIMMYIE